MGILTITLTVLVIVSWFGLWKSITVQEAKIDFYEQYIKDISEEIKIAYDKMLAVELSEAFASDDEVGEAFSKIKSLVEKLRNEIADD